MKEAERQLMMTIYIDRQKQLIEGYKQIELLTEILKVKPEGVINRSYKGNIHYDKQVLTAMKGAVFGVITELKELKDIFSRE